MDESVAFPGIGRLCLAVSLLISAGAPSRSSAQQDSGIVTLEHADSLVGREIAGERVRELIGNVRFSQGKTHVDCHHAIQYLSRDRIELDGEVAVREDSLTLYTNRGVYYGATKMAEALDGVRMNDGITFVQSAAGTYFSQTKRAHFTRDVIVQDTASTLTADEVWYYRAEERMIADGSVTITNAGNAITIHGGHFEHEKLSRFSAMTLNPRAVQIDTAEDGTIDSLVVTSKRMESYQDSLQRLVTIDSTRMMRRNFSGICGRSVFFTQLDSIEMKESPFVWYASADEETTQVSGDSMYVHLHDRKLDRLDVRGSAVAISQADTAYPRRFHQMTGQVIVMHFTGGAISEINVNQTATMLYYLFDGERPNGLNTTTGDHVTVTFIDRKIDRIKVVGGVEGQYVPERLLAGHEAEHNLAGFNWKDQRPRTNP